MMRSEPKERITVGAAKALLARAKQAYEVGDVLTAHRLAVKALLWANDCLHSLQLRKAAFRDNTLYVRKLGLGPKGKGWSVTGAARDGKSLVWTRPARKPR
ncbi:MAG: hypothetical protein HY748_00920 [Elusimicrobia bacterium]|nr:hypothetical protein [Elusimicrobiota bacterium]